MSSKKKTEKKKEERTVEERLDQLEKDVEQLTFEYRKLLMWKKLQAIKSLPKPHGEPPL